jgi:hypothetical protein
MSACWSYVTPGAALVTIAALMAAAVLVLAVSSLLEEGLPSASTSDMLWFAGRLALFVAVFLLPGLGPFLLALALLVVQREQSPAHSAQDVVAALAASLACSTLFGAALAAGITLLLRGRAQHGCAGHAAVGPAVSGIVAGSFLTLLFVLVCCLLCMVWLACFPRTSNLLSAVRGHAAKLMSKSVEDDGSEASSNVSYGV